MTSAVRRERGREKDVGKERKPEHICGAAEGTAQLLCDPEHDGKATENHQELGFGWSLPRSHWTETSSACGLLLV